MTCHFCKDEARASYQTLRFCSYHLLLFYLGVDYAVRKA